MARVLVTGGTGTLGKPLVRELLRRAHEVRVLSRSASPTLPPGVSAVQGDVRTGAGLKTAAENVDAIVHAATNPFWRPKSTEVDGTRNVRDAAAAAGVPHLLYVSIVGVDRFSVPYYKAKWAAEQVVEQTDGGWTVQRITQFHDLVDRFFSLRVFPHTGNLSFQPIDVTDASRRLADLLDAGPQERANDIGGPEVLSARELRDQRRAVTGQRALLIPAPVIGPLRALEAGHHLAPDGRHGTQTWKQWLSQQAAR
jgi:uncharacterized protein YbjT (DUF2867 family)